MCTEATSSTLSVRCIELHLYTAGGGLTDPGHNDLGSVLTLSVMLSDPGPSERGGRFTTTDALGNTTAHELITEIGAERGAHSAAEPGEGTKQCTALELQRASRVRGGRADREEPPAPRSPSRPPLRRFATSTAPTLTPCWPGT